MSLIRKQQRSRWLRIGIALGGLGAISSTHDLRADVTMFTDASAWEATVGGEFSTIDFTGFPDTTPITDQYSRSGVLFTSPAFIFGPTLLFANDGWGLHGPFNLHLVFDSPQNWIAVDYPGAIQFELYHSGNILYVSTYFQPGGMGNFAGLVSNLPFDEVRLVKPKAQPTHVGIDDLHWGGGEPKSPCPEVVGDLTGDCSVGVADLLELLAQWGPCRNNRPCPADLTGSGHVDVDDLLILLANWG